MFALDESGRAQAFALYLREEPFFPLVGAVLLGEQDGLVLADDPDAPRQVYVEHGFGFAQVFGRPGLDFERSLARYLIADRLFACPKVRLYAPHPPAFLEDPACLPLRAWRQRFILDKEALDSQPPWLQTTESAPRAVEVTAENVDVVERAFGVVSRFWRSAEDFVRKARASLVLDGGEPAAICYAAAQAAGKVEIDVLTLPRYRRRGLGLLAVADFSRRCFEASLQPLWDCFTNNTGSMQLSRAAGFRALTQPYPFFTIPKDRT